MAGSDGSIDITVTGGTTPYTYAWSSGDNIEDPTTLSAGTYEVTVTDANGCTIVGGPYVVGEPTPVLASITIDAQPDCEGEATGSATASGSGGTGPYEYLWSNGQITATATGLTAGTYLVTVTDANGCTGVTSVLLEDPTGITAEVTSVTNRAVQRGVYRLSGSRRALAAAGSYTYLWSNGQTAATATGLAAGQYTVTVTEDGVPGCEAVAYIEITEPTDLISEIISSSDVSCFGAGDGTALVNATGGTTPYNYEWSDGQTTAMAGNLAPGSYDVTVTDANDCTSVSVVEIDGPAAPLDITTTPAVITDVSCNGGSDGSIDITVTGGTAPYTYAWSSGDNIEDPSTLSAGTYEVTVTDANGCTIVGGTYEIDEPTEVTASAVVNSDPDCEGNTTGEAAVTAGGGTPSYSYLWSDGQTGATASNLSAGTYLVTVTDANGCQAVASVLLVDPTGVKATITSSTNLDCAGDSDGEATVTAAGGTAPYTYEWSTTPVVQTTATAVGLEAGQYSVTVTDDNGCQAVAIVEITEPTALELELISQENVSCNGGNDGEAAVNVTGGVTPYTYLWSASAGGQVTATAINLPLGTHGVTVTDANGCTITGSVLISQPSLLTSSTTLVSDVSCNGGSDGVANVTASGGTSPYGYIWDNGSTDEQLNGVPAGTYSVTVTDDNNCTSVSSVVISEPATGVSVSVTSVADPDCEGTTTGSITASAAGGVGPYMYLWSDGQTGATASGLSAGTYVVTATDANGCTASVSQLLVDPTGITATIVSSTNLSCFGDMDGSATVEGSGGSGTYTYSWSNGQTTATATGLVAGQYTVTVTDTGVSGCEAVAFVEITEPTELISEIISSSDVSCFGAGDGTALVNATGGTTPYGYEWSDGQTTAMASNLAPGSYDVTVTDANGCEAVPVVVISGP